MTEDMVVELSQKLSELGTSEEAAKQRARMQSAQLLSDMQAFKVIVCQEKIFVLYRNGHVDL